MTKRGSGRRLCSAEVGENMSDVIVPRLTCHMAQRVHVIKREEGETMTTTRTRTRDDVHLTCEKISSSGVCGRRAVVRVIPELDDLDARGWYACARHAARAAAEMWAVPAGERGQRFVRLER